MGERMKQLFFVLLIVSIVLVSNSDARKKKKRKHPSTPLPADGSSAAQMRHLMSLLRRHPRAAEPEPEHPYVMPGEHASKQLVDRSMDELFGDRTLGEGRHDPGGYFRRPLVVLSLRNRNSPDLRSAVRYQSAYTMGADPLGHLLHDGGDFSAGIAAAPQPVKVKPLDPFYHPDINFAARKRRHHHDHPEADH